MSKFARKVGKAVVEALLDRRGFDELFDSIDAETKREIYDAVGRAAIEAMREPTEAMILKGLTFHEPGYSDMGQGWVDGGINLRKAWPAMIDEALK